jgi:putative addiction module CopG family antidote
MNISLPSELKKFVEKKVNEGLYQSEADVIGDALRQLMARELLPHINALGSLTNFTASDVKAVSNMSEDADIEANVFVILMQVAKEMDNDLKMIMAEIKSMTAAKQKLREIINKINKDIANNLGQIRRRPPLKFQKDGIGSQKAYHVVPIPFADPESIGGVKLIPTDLFSGEIIEVSQLVIIKEEITAKLDSMNEMSEMTSLHLQMMMDRRSKILSTLSNILKKLSSTQESIIQNIK